MYRIWMIWKRFSLPFSHFKELYFYVQNLRKKNAKKMFEWQAIIVISICISQERHEKNAANDLIWIVNNKQIHLLVFTFQFGPNLDGIAHVGGKMFRSEHNLDWHARILHRFLNIQMSKTWKPQSAGRGKMETADPTIFSSTRLNKFSDKSDRSIVLIELNS